MNHFQVVDDVGIQRISDAIESEIIDGDALLSLAKTTVSFNLAFDGIMKRIQKYTFITAGACNI